MLTEYVIPFVFSLFDTASIMILIMSVFDISFKDNTKETIASIFGLTVISTGLVFVGLHNYSLFILIPSLILTLIFVFKENITFSIFVSIVSIVAFLSLQVFLTYLFLTYGIMNAEDNKPFTFWAYFGQMMTFIIVFAITTYQRRFGIRFMFDFNNVFGRKRNVPSSKPYVFVSCVIGIIIILVYPQFYNQGVTTELYISFTISLISFVLLLLLSFKRDKEEQEASYK